MNVHYVTGISPKNDTGGAGVGVGGLFSSAKGHTITVYDSPDKYDAQPPDLIWISNMMCKYTIQDVERITRNFTVPYIVQDDGYMNLCPQPTREYKLCFQDLCLDPKWEGGLASDGSKYGDVRVDGVKYPDPPYNCDEICLSDMMQRLFESANAVVCVSPLHGEIWGKIFPIIKDKTIVYDPQVDVDRFKPAYGQHAYRRKDGTYLWAGTIANGKGYYNCCKYVDSIGTDMSTAGDIHHTVPKSDVRNWIGRLPHSEMHKVYTSFEHFLHIPEWPEPQGLTVTEAILCGCKVIANEKVGALTYPWWDEHLDREWFTSDALPGMRLQKVALARKGRKLREFLREAGSRFWSDVESYML